MALLNFFKGPPGGTTRARGGAAEDAALGHLRRQVLRLPAPPPCRFDVVAIDGERIEWLRAAFDAG